MRCLVVLLFVVIAPAAAADPVALMDAPHASDVAVAGTDVVVTRNLPGGGVTVDALAVQGGAVRNLLSLPSPRPRWHGRASVAASAQWVAVLVAFDDSGDLPRERRLYTGPPAGPLRLEFARRIPRRGGWLPLDVDVDADRVLLSELRFPRLRSRLHVLAPGAPPARVPWAGRLLPGPFALAGDHVALGGASRLFVVDRRSGEREASTALGPGDVSFDVDLAPDGRAVADFDVGLVTIAPGEPRAVVPGSGGHSLSKPQFAGSHIGALEQTGFIVRPVVLDPGAAQPRAVGSPSAAFGAFASDERGFAWIANGCVLYAPVDGAPPSEPPDGPCPRAEVTIEDADQILRGRRVRLEVTCVAAPAPGCLGSLVLRNRGIAGRGRFSVPAGTTAVIEAVLNRRGARRVRRVLRRSGEAFLALDARPQDGRVPGGNRSQSIVIDRAVRR